MFEHTKAVNLSLLRFPPKYSVAKNVAKIVDNCRAHPNVKGLKTTEFVFLPPNTTGHTQPMDQGITKIQKSHYKKQGHLETTSSS
jgi:hypothetical protein